jgi:Ribonuclease G/E
VQQGRRHVEAAAIHVEIGERQRAGVLEAGTIHPQQQVGIFGVRVVVPAQPVVTEGQARDNGDHCQR